MSDLIDMNKKPEDLFEAGMIIGALKAQLEQKNAELKKRKDYDDLKKEVEIKTAKLVTWSSMLQVSGKRTPSKTQTQKSDQLALKNIVDPFLTWHNSQFENCLEEIKKYPDYVSLIEESFSDDGGFEVNEQTLYNILSAELQGGSKVQSTRTYRPLPTIPQSIANATNLRQKTYTHKLNENLSSSNKKNLTTSKRKHCQLVPDDFVDTEELCKNMSHLRIVEQYFKSTSPR